MGRPAVKVAIKASQGRGLRLTDASNRSGPGRKEQVAQVDRKETTPTRSDRRSASALRSASFQPGRSLDCAPLNHQMLTKSGFASSAFLEQELFPGAGHQLCPGAAVQRPSPSRASGERVAKTVRATTLSSDRRLLGYLDRAQRSPGVSARRRGLMHEARRAWRRASETRTPT